MWRTAELLSLLTANFRKTISSSVTQIVLLFFVRCKKIISQAFEFAPNLLQSVSKQTHPMHMSIGNYTGVRVCLYFLRPDRRKKHDWHACRGVFTTIDHKISIYKAETPSPLPPCLIGRGAAIKGDQRSPQGVRERRQDRTGARCTAKGRA
jgi:hypothetical protein